MCPSLYLNESQQLSYSNAYVCSFMWLFVIDSEQLIVPPLRIFVASPNKMAASRCLPQLDNYIIARDLVYLGINHSGGYPLAVWSTSYGRSSSPHMLITIN